MKKIAFSDLFGIASIYLHSEASLDAKVYNFFKKQFTGDLLFLDSGTSAMQALIEDFQLQNSQIILPSFICSDVFTSLFVQNNIVPIIIDCASGSLNMSLPQIKKAITPKTKALIIVHTLGIPCFPEEARALCDKNKILLVEDCAHSISTPYKNKFLGSYGDASVFSFAKEMPNFSGGVYLNNKRQISPSIRNSIKQFKWSKKYVKILARKFIRSKISQNNSTPSLFKITPKNMPKLAKAIFCYYFPLQNSQIKKALALKLLEKTPSSNQIVTTEQISSFSGKSYPILKDNRKAMLENLFQIGLEPGIGWTPTLSQNILAKNKWQVPSTPIAERYSKELLTISLDEVNNKNLPAISKAIIKE